MEDKVLSITGEASLERPGSHFIISEVCCYTLQTIICDDLRRFPVR